MLRFLRRGLQLVVLVFAAAQLAGLAQAYHPLFDSFAHFRLVFSVLLALGVVALLVFGSWRIALIAALVSSAGVVAMMPILVQTPIPAGEPTLTFVQFNTLFRNRTPEKVIDQIRSAKADAVTLQEVSDRTRIIMDNLKAEYPFQVFCGYGGRYGDAVLSRWPVVLQGCGDDLGLAWLQLQVNGRMITVASLHLHWPYPVDQAEQITRLEPALGALPQPLVLGGDFNAAPWSHSATRVAAASLTHVATGLRLSWRIGPRLLGGPWPILPIDQVLLPEGAVADIKVGEPAGSDHLPLIARVFLPSP